MEVTMSGTPVMSYWCPYCGMIVGAGTLAHQHANGEWVQPTDVIRRCRERQWSQAMATTCVQLATGEVVLGRDFLDALVKRSAEADQVLQDCGRIRLLAVVKAAIELYLASAGRTEGGE
jgi:hypothetical protein